MSGFRALRFVKSAVGVDDCPGKPLPWLALAGRSNVGKSSLLNALSCQKKLARVANTPGKTAYLNFYELPETLYIVDLPGYGYAAVSKQERLRWAEMMETFFARAILLRAALLVLDARREPSPDDAQMRDYLQSAGLPFGVIANKTDKLSVSERAAAEETLPAFAPGRQTVFCAAAKRDNIDAVGRLIKALI